MKSMNKHNKIKYMLFCCILVGSTLGNYINVEAKEANIIKTANLEVILKDTIQNKVYYRNSFAKLKPEKINYEDYQTYVEPNNNLWTGVEKVQSNIDVLKDTITTKNYFTDEMSTDSEMLELNETLKKLNWYTGLDNLMLDNNNKVTTAGSAIFQALWELKKEKGTLKYLNAKENLEKGLPVNRQIIIDDINNKLKQLGYDNLVDYMCIKDINSKENLGCISYALIAMNYNDLNFYKNDIVMPTENVGEIKYYKGETFDRINIVKTALSIYGVPYFWGGKSEKVGLDSNWGQPRIITAEGSSVQPVGSLYPYGLDCSGFTEWVFKQYGIEIGQGTMEQWNNTDSIEYKDLKIGDLGFYSPPEFYTDEFGTAKYSLNHVGIYIGKINGKDAFIHSGGINTWGKVVVTYNDSNELLNGQKPSKFKYFKRVKEFTN